MSYPITILSTGHALASIRPTEGDFDDWIRAGLSLPSEDVVVVDAQDADAVFPTPQQTSGVVVTGSHEMVTDRKDWMLRSEAWLRELVDNGTPLLGICFGHQLVADALGGEVIWRPNGREIGTVEIAQLPPAFDDPLLSALPPTFLAQTSHAQSVSKLPEGATLLASSRADRNTAFRIKDSAWAVQFHPEFSEVATRAYIEWNRQSLVEQGQDPDRLLAEVSPSPAGKLLARFAEIVRSNVQR